MTKYFIDLGSSTIKVYEYKNELVLLEEHSIYFKNGYTDEFGINEATKLELTDYIRMIKDEYNLEYENTNIFATGIFRNLEERFKREMILLFKESFDLHLEIISHGLENYYLGKALENDYQSKKVMVINMGGKTTEIVTIDQNRIVERFNLQIGVAELLNRFPEVNNSYSKVSIESMNQFVKEAIADVTFDTDYDCAIFTGGEERFEKLTKYPLIENSLFHDGIHKYMISLDDYKKATERVFFEMTLNELYSLMPQNPKWMDGARPGAILPLAIFEKANIPYIVPSDLNLIHGVINDMRG